MRKTLWKSALLGGIIVFIWGIVSWMLLPWHMMTTHKFINEEQVATALKANAPQTGIYFLPSCQIDDSNNQGQNEQPSKEDQQQAKADLQKKMEDAKARMKRGPIVFASVCLEGMDPASPKPFIGSLIIQIIAAFLASWLLMHTKAQPYMRHVGFVTVIGLFAGVVSALPSWNWMGFSVGWTIVSILDLVIGWFLAGLAIAKIIKK
jgi:hypothetical protein